MPAPVTVSIEVPQPQREVFDFLDVMANHEPFTDHLMRDWELSGPERARVDASSRPHASRRAGQLPVAHQVVVERLVVRHDIEEREHGVEVLRDVDGDDNWLRHVPHGTP